MPHTPNPFHDDNNSSSTNPNSNLSNLMMLANNNVTPRVVGPGRWSGYSLPVTPRVAAVSNQEAAKHRMEKLVRTAAPGASTKVGTAAMVYRLFERHGAGAVVEDEETVAVVKGWRPVPRRPYSSVELD